RPVVATWVHDNEPTRTELTIDTDGTTGSATATLEATDWHPIWAADLNAWTPIANIKAGSWLRTSAGTWVQVTAVRQYTSNTLAHDLTIDGIHTYHVLAATTPILVHNCAAKRKTVQENDAGEYGDLSPGQVGDGLEANHIPQKALKFTTVDEGGAIVMKAADHALTRTYKGRGRATAIADANLSFREVLAKDLWDMRRIGQIQYNDPSYFNKGIKGLLALYRKKGML
ncbi:hypothetical protein DMH04_56630, partial [Kibdelosporangium aridum]